MEGCLALICDPSFSLLAAIKNSFQISEIKLPFTLKRLETRIYLLMVWNGAKNYMQTRCGYPPAEWQEEKMEPKNLNPHSSGITTRLQTAGMKGDFTKDLHIN